MIIALLVILGLMLGSFANALVYRLHQQSINSRKSKVTKSKAKKAVRNLSTFNFRHSTKEDSLSIINGRSMCPHCKHRLSSLDLVPVFSWVLLRGKCRYCRKQIGVQYPLVELVTASAFVASYLWWPTIFDNAGKVNFAVWLIMLTGFIALIVYDGRWMILPNRVIYPLIAVAASLVMANATVFHGGLAYVRDTAFSVAVAGGLFYGLYKASKGKWIGFGDVKLGILIGLLLNDAPRAFLVLFLASLLGTLVVLPGLIKKKITSSSHIPFGPFLIIATVIVKLFGTALIEWYKRVFLPGI